MRPSGGAEMGTTKGTQNPGVMRAVVLHRGEDGYWVVEVPSLPGCISQGKTKPEAINNISRGH